MKIKKSLSAIVAACVIMAGATMNVSAQSSISTNAADIGGLTNVLALIHNLHTIKLIPTNYVGIGLTVDQVMSYVETNTNLAPYVVQELFRAAAAKRVRLWEASASAPYGDLLGLLYGTRLGVPLNLTDKRLAACLAGGGSVLETKTAHLWASKLITTNGLQVLETMPPEQAATWVGIVCTPYYTLRKPLALPLKAPIVVTWASTNYQNIQFYERERQFAQKSVIVKFLLDMGNLALPHDAYVHYADDGGTLPDAIIGLSLGKLFDTSYIPILEELVNNVYYSDEAWKIIFQVE